MCLLLSLDAYRLDLLLSMYVFGAQSRLCCLLEQLGSFGTVQCKCTATAGPVVQALLVVGAFLFCLLNWAP